MKKLKNLLQHFNVSDETRARYAKAKNKPYYYEGCANLVWMSKTVVSGAGHSVQVFECFLGDAKGNDGGKPSYDITQVRRYKKYGDFDSRTESYLIANRKFKSFDEAAEAAELQFRYDMEEQGK